MILYFSGTGNSLSVARDLAAKTHDVAVHITEVMKRETISDEVIGIVYPVYFADIPEPLEEFLKKFIFNPEKQYIYAVATYGLLLGNANKTIAIMLEAKGAKLSYASEILMPDNQEGIVIGSKAPSTENLLERQEYFVNKISKAVLAKEEMVIDKKRNKLKLLEHKIRYGGMKRDAFDKSVDKNMCVGCGVCQRVCPSENIKIIEGKSHIGDKCVNCLACIQWCPQGSITAKKKHINGKQYHHPKVVLNDMFLREYKKED